jgi:two-component system sensor kinase FixL
LRTGLAGCGIAAGTVGLAAVTQHALTKGAPSVAPFVLFFFAISVTGMLAGAVWAGVCAALSAGLTSWLGWLPSSQGLLPLLEFGVASGGVVALSYLHSARADREREAARELNLLIEGATGYAIYMYDAAGRVSVWNEGARRLMGWSSAEVVAKHCSIFYTQMAVAEGLPEHHLRTAATKGSLNGEDWHVRKDGSRFLARFTIKAFYDNSGTLRGYGKLIRDITQQRAERFRAAASENHYRSILATVPDAMVVTNRAGNILSFSAAAERLFGLSESEVVGTSFDRLIASSGPQGRAASVDHYLTVTRSSSDGVGCTLLGRRGDGSTFPLRLSVGQAITEGKPIFTAFFRDLTEQRRTEERLEELRTSLVHAARGSAMGTMASTLGHELNQPITAVVNYMRGIRNLLREGNEEDRDMIDDALADAMREGLRAGEILRHLHDFESRGEMEFTVEALPQLIEEASQLALIGARERGVWVTFDIDPSATPVLVDRIQIQQVLINLIRNAIEAMAESPVRHLSVSTRVEEEGCVRATVADTGSGIAPEAAAKLFRAFNSTKSGGMGLGLSICRTIVEASGGKIWAEPRSGGGTAFHFTMVQADQELAE